MQPSLKRSTNISSLASRQRVYVKIFQRLRPHTLIHLITTSQTFYTLVTNYINSGSLTYIASESHQAEDLRAWLGLLKVLMISPKTSLVLPRFFSVTNILMENLDRQYYISLLLEVVTGLLLRSKTFLSELHCNLDLSCDILFKILQELNLRVLVFHRPYKELSREYYLEFNRILQSFTLSTDSFWNSEYSSNPQIKALDDVATEVFHVCRNLTSLTIPARVMDFILPNSLEMQILDEDYEINLTHLSTVLVVRAGDLEHERVLSLQCHFYKHLLSLTLDIEQIPGVNHLFLTHRHLQRLALYSSTGLVECPLLVFPSLRKVTIELRPLEQEHAGVDKFIGVFLTMEAFISLFANSINISYINAVYSDQITKTDITEKLYGLRYESLTFLRLRFFPVKSEELERHGITSAALARLAHKMPRLRKLTLSGFRDMLGDTHVACILKSCPFLEELSLTGRHDVLPNTKPYICSCNTQLLWHSQSETAESLDGSSEHSTVYTAYNRHFHREVTCKSSMLAAAEHPPCWTGPAEESQEPASPYLTSKLTVLKLKQIYITDVTFINLYLLGAGDSLKVLWIDALPRISSIGVGLLINQVLLYGPLLTTPVRQIPTQPVDFSDQVYTSLTKRVLSEHNERYVRGLCSDLCSDAESIEESSPSSHSECTTTITPTHDKASEALDNLADCTATTSTALSTSFDIDSLSAIYKETVLTERVRDWWVKRLQRLDKHICRYQELLKAQRDRQTLLKITNLSFSDSYLPLYHVPKYDIAFISESEPVIDSGQPYMNYVSGPYDQLEYDAVLTMSSFSSLDNEKDKPQSDSLHANLSTHRFNDSVSHINVGPKSSSEAHSPYMAFVIFRTKHQPFISMRYPRLNADSIYSLFSAHGVCRRTFKKIVGQNNTGTLGAQYRIVYDSALQTVSTIEWTSFTPLQSRDISIADATFFPLAHKLAKDKTMPLPATLLSWILSEYFESSALEKVSVANCELVDGNLVTSLATTNTQSLHSLQLKLLFPVHHTAFHTLVLHHSHSLRYLYLLPFSSESENEKFIDAVKQISNILTIDLDWKTERSLLFI
ncbi:Hypothetical protein DHA2_150423 [Giardia duodenalis]|uniref:F-box domain-containing protein n=1 Tax=Giardia intestinalis TaxID=5741 RepID=V6TBL1_GIAIN|nr:Hypothetical protein DHA2_150423 [Giardia intestinalis]